MKNGEKTLPKHILESKKNKYFKKLRRDLKEKVKQSQVFFLVQVTSWRGEEEWKRQLNSLHFYL